MPNESSRLDFTAAVLLLLFAGLQSWIAYSGTELTIGTYAVPAVMSWAAAAVFTIVGVLTMRAAHLSQILPTATVE